MASLKTTRSLAAQAAQTLNGPKSSHTKAQPSPRRRPLPRTLLIAILAAVIGMLASSIRRQPRIEGSMLETYLPPSKDPFYAAPSNISSFPPGSIVRARSVPSGTHAKAAYQLAFRTTDAHGSAQLGVTTTLVPRWSRVPARLISFQLFQNSAHVDCSVSYSILPNSTSPNRAALAGATDAIADLLLLMGYTVTLPDHLGPKSAFTVGKQQGYTTLDAIRSSLSHRPSIPWPWGVKASMVAYSGGGSATAWAAQLQPSYAPELSFAGAALGGLPVRPAKLIPNLEGTKNMGLALASILGMANVYPQLEDVVRAKATERGSRAIEDIRSGEMCLDQLLEAHAGMDMADFFQDWSFDDAAVSGVFEENTLGADVARMPLYLWHGVKDDVTPIDDVDEWVSSQCSRGARITYSRDGLSDHVSAATPFTILSALLWIDARYSLPFLSLPPGKCAVRTQDHNVGPPWLPNSGFEVVEHRRKALADLVGNRLVALLGDFARPTNETVGSDS